MTSVPPGWSPRIPPPGDEDFTARATDFLLDALPPGYRDHDILRRHPVALAWLAHCLTEAAVTGHRRGYRVVRTELGGHVPPHAIDSVLSAYRTEGQRLAATARSADLVARALRARPAAQAARSGEARNEIGSGRGLRPPVRGLENPGL